MKYPSILTALLILGMSNQHISAQDFTSNCNQCNRITIQVDTSGDLPSIEWSTDREVNIRYFNVEKSLDDITFYTLATVLPANSYSLPAHYRVNDGELIDSSWSIVYYRVNVIDMNGKKYFSEHYGVTNTCPSNRPVIRMRPEGILSQKDPF